MKRRFAKGRGPVVSRRGQRLVDFAVLRQPVHVTSLSMLFHRLQELNCFRFVARLARVIVGNDQFDIDGHDVTIRVDEARTLDSQT